VDAVVSAVSGIALIAFAELFANLLQLPVELVSEVGIVFLPFAAFVGFVASRTEPARIAVWAVIALNVAWVVESIMVLLTAWITPNALGHGVVIAQAAGVLVLADLEYMGYRKYTRALDLIEGAS